MSQIYFDRLAIALSSLCALHCIALPIAASLIPLLASTIHHGNELHGFWFHEFIHIFILPVSLIALIAGFRCHKQSLPIIVGSMGLIVLVFTAMFAGHLIHNHILPHFGETLLTIIGGVIHATGHVMNMLATKASRTKCSVG